MRLLLSDGCFYKSSLDYVFYLANKSGFDGIEIIWDGKNELNIENISSLKEKYSLDVPVIHEPFFFHDVKDWPSKDCERLPYVIKVAEDVGAEKIVVHAGIQKEKIIWQKKNIPVLQKNTNVKICMENMPEEYGVLFNFYDKLNEIYRKYYGIAHKSTTPDLRKKMFFMKTRWNYYLNKPENLTYFDHIILDTTHLGTCSIDPSEYFMDLNDKVQHIHLSDFGPDEHILPGKGILRLNRFISTLKENNYKNTISLEVDPSAFTDYNNEKLTLKELNTIVDMVKS